MSVVPVLFNVTVPRAPCVKLTILRARKAVGLSPSISLDNSSVRTLNCFDPRFDTTNLPLSGSFTACGASFTGVTAVDVRDHRCFHRLPVRERDTRTEDRC